MIDPRFTPPPISDAGLYELRWTRLAAPVVALAQDLGVVDRFVASPLTTAALRAELGFSERAAEAMVAVLAAAGVLSRQADDHFTATTLARTYLAKGAPFAFGPIVDPQDTVVQRLRPAFAAESAPPAPMAVVMPDLDDATVRGFISQMHRVTRPASTALVTAPEFDGVRRLLDVAGGSGSLSAAIVAGHPGLEATLFDLPRVCEAAADHLDSLGMSDRVTLHPGDMFHGPWPSDHDGVLFGNIFHDWEAERCRQLAQSAFAALPPGGRVFLHEMLLDEGKDGPLLVACFSVTMLLHERGKQYTATELAAMLEGAGFVDFQARPSYGYYALVTARKPS